MRFSVVIPVHNEAAHLEASVARFLDDLASRGIRDAEIFLVENGSTDGTFETGLVLERRFPGEVRTLRIPEASYGEAVRRGVPEASGEAVFVLECDALDPEFVSRALGALGRNETDFVVGSKRHPESVDGRPPSRRLFTRLFNLALKALFAFPGTDTHGFKALRTDAARDLIQKSVTGGESLQTELVLLAHRLGYRVSEAPVQVREIRGTPVSILRRLPMVLRIVADLRASLRRFPAPGRDSKGGPSPAAGRLIVAVLFLLTFLYPVYLLTRAEAFYFIFMALFVLLAALLAFAAVKGIARHPWLLAVVVLLVLVRLPFYLVHDGLITSSDDALEALQSREIQATHTAPFYLLEALHHQGTWKYLFVAYLWAFFGRGYVWVPLLQLMFFAAFLYLFFAAFKKSFAPAVLLLLCAAQFAFVEVLFDYSLAIRGGPYLEMIVLFLLGVALFDFDFRKLGRLSLAYFFMFWPVYLHPLAAVFAAAFAATAGILALGKRRLGPNLAALAAGGAAGLATPAAYLLLFKAKPGAVEGFETIKIGLPGITAFAELGARLTAVFTSLFRNELSYFLQFFKEEGGGRVLSLVNWGVVGLSLAVLVAGLGLALRDVVAALRRKAAPPAARWADIFMLLLFAAFLAKALCLTPFREEPRHNFDLLILILLAYAKVLSRFAGLFRRRTFRTVAAAALLLALAAPHYAFFLKMARRKNAYYHRLMATLADKNVKYLTGDFGIVYIVHFLSDGRILVSDSIGPMTVPCFYPGMRELVDRAPETERAVFIFSRKYTLSLWRGWKTVPLRKKIDEDIRKRHLRYERIRTDDYLLLVPKPAGPPKAKAPKNALPNKKPRR